MLEANRSTLARMAKIAQVDISATAVDLPQAVHGVSQTVQISLPLAGLVDLDKERERLKKEIEKLVKEAGKLEGRLGNPGFRDRAPAAVVQEVEGQLSEIKAQQEILKDRLQQLG